MLAVEENLRAMLRADGGWLYRVPPAQLALQTALLPSWLTSSPCASFQVWGRALVGASRMVVV